jgi:sensor histidine kinase YesM
VGRADARDPLDGARFPPGIRTAAQRWRVAAHAAASLLVALAQAHAFVFLLPRVQPEVWRGMATSELVLNAIVANLQSNVLLYWVIVLATVLVRKYEWYRERDLRAAQLETRLTRAELEVLKMQLHPHFLFNTLHAISALVHDNPETADRIITRLGDLLRLTLDAGSQQEVPLRRELDFADKYLEIEQTRLGDRLRVERRLDPAALDALVPTLILQPAVENAIRHGIAPAAAGGTITLEARREGDMLRLDVRDDGQGLDAGGWTEGVGLSNIRLRLRQLYGDTQRLEITGGPGAGTHVSLSLPYRLATPSATASHSARDTEPERDS